MTQANQSLNLKLDHVFILVEPRAKVADRLLEQGFREGARNTHLGQGTANRRFYFANGMLEFLWMRNTLKAMAYLAFKYFRRKVDRCF